MLGRSEPVRLRVGAIGMDTGLVGLGLDAEGVLEVPRGAHPAGWFRGAPTPGEAGPAILTGHVDYSGKPGVFAHLGRVEVGDQIQVERADGRVAVFEAYEIEAVSKGRFPTEKVYGNQAGAELRLITCTGRFDRRQRAYQENLIVYARLVAVR